MNWILPLGPWKRANGYPFRLDTIVWLWFPQWAGLVEAYEIDSMAYITARLDSTEGRR